MTKKYMTQQEFSEYIKKSKQYVSELKSKNNLILTKSGLINVEKSIDLLEKNSDPAKSKIDFNSLRNVEKSIESYENIENNDYDFNKGRAKEQHYKAELAKIKALKEADSVIETDILYSQISSVFASFKNQLQSLSKRLSIPLSQMKDVLEIENLLNFEIDNIIKQNKERAAKTVDIVKRNKDSDNIDEIIEKEEEKENE